MNYIPETIIIQNKDYITGYGLAEAIGIPEWKVYQLVKSKELPKPDILYVKRIWKYTDIMPFIEKLKK